MANRLSLCGLFFGDASAIDNITVHHFVDSARWYHNKFVVLYTYTYMYIPHFIFYILLAWKWKGKFGKFIGRYETDCLGLSILFLGDFCESESVIEGKCKNILDFS